jgi:amino acid adenylation domain-containing protein
MIVEKLGRDSIEDVMALTPLQEGMLFHYLKEPESDQYFEQLCLEVTGEIEGELLQRAWNEVAAGNEMLRAVFRWRGVKKPVQIVLKRHTVQLHIVDGSAGQGGGEAQFIEEIKQRDRRHKFDLEEVPFRVTWCPLSRERHIILVSLHHILYDGWSTAIILKEFLTLYEALTVGGPARLPPKSRFKAFVRWLSGQEKERQRTYWQDYLADLEGMTRMPVKGDGSTGKERLRQHNHRIAPQLTAAAASWIKQQKITLASLLYGVWGIILHKYGDCGDVVFGTTVSGRNARLKDIENMVGLFINTVPLRFRAYPDQEVSSLLAEVNRGLQAREPFEVTPLTDIKEYTGTTANEELFDNIVVIENYPLDRFLSRPQGPLSISGCSMFYRTNYDLTVAISLLADGEIEVTFTYEERLFAGGVIPRLGGHFEKILSEVVTGPARALAEIDMLTGPEKQQLLIDFNDTAAGCVPELPLQRRFELQVEKTPGRIAVVGSDGIPPLTYRELNERANRLARWLRRQGVVTGAVVAIMLEPSARMVAALLAVLKAGAAYLPIDPGTPPERVRYMLEDAGVDRLLTDTPSVGDAALTGLQNFAAADRVEVVKTPDRPPIREFDRLPVPDRSLIDLRNYRGKIGMASVTNCISIQSTRGCPYECLFCHKIWSKKHVHRRAENIYDEIEYYYKNGVGNFAFIDDCFNLDRSNSCRLFRLLLQHKLAVRLFFPNGLRGDIMTPDYIDLMAEAGTRGINLSLETASPRLQRLLRKNLDLDKFKKVVDYIAADHPEVMLELASMHGFPTETQEEAMITLDFIKGIRWLHFPYIHILKIFPHTEMEAFALANGISRRDILTSRDRAFHELPETLPFPRSFTRQYQADFMNDYFLNKERLKQVLPVQMQILSEEALVQKYNAYLPVEIRQVEDVIRFARLEGIDIPDGYGKAGEDEGSIFDRGVTVREPGPRTRRVLLLDLSQHFSSHQMLYKVAEQPLGLIYLLTYLKERFGDQIDGRIYKSGSDFDSYEELRSILSDYRPHLIGIRTLTFFKEFFHETAALIRQWGIEVPIITGGPYASSDYDTILKDPHVDLVVSGEGEHTVAELLETMLQNNFTWPDSRTLERIRGIAFVREGKAPKRAVEVVMLDRLSGCLAEEKEHDLDAGAAAGSLAYVMYTSGSTGRPKGVMVEHGQVNNCLRWMQEKFQLTPEAVVVQRTNPTFDPSVWEIFWPLSIGGGMRILKTNERRDGEFLIRLLSGNRDLTVMYCPATLVTAMTYLLDMKGETPQLRLPWLIIGAEPIGPETVQAFYNYFDGRIVNTYGPTECTINNTYYDLTAGDCRSPVPIGRPVSNNRVYILSRDGQPLPLYVKGEIGIAGDSLARGYINNPQLTADKFVNLAAKGREDTQSSPHQILPTKSQPLNPISYILYRTGDVGRWCEDGSLEILGRLDGQVKIRGHRIEPGEIEGVLLRHPSVQEAVVAVRDRRQSQREVKACKRCGITSKYPNTLIDDGVCEICRKLETYRRHLSAYFRTTEDLRRTIRAANGPGQSAYDCLLLYAGGRGSAYALYQLVDMGFSVLAVTYDNGYFGKRDIDHIKMICAKLGVDHITLTHRRSDKILRESLQAAGTVCRGCFHTSFSLAADYAFRQGIKVVVGATLSRGQIIENKLFMFLHQGITDVAQLERSILDLQRSAVDIDRKIFDHIAIDSVRDEALYRQVKFVDFYRYCDITNREMIDYLDNRDPYWKTRKDYAVYSTNCPLKQIGDFGHLQERGFHFYGSATSWEARLGHLSLKDVEEDLACRVGRQGYERFARRIGCRAETAMARSDKYLAAYVVSSGTVAEGELKEYLSGRLPGYMVPDYLVQLEHLPLLPTGKIDRRALPEPESGRSRSAATYVAPANDRERQIAAVWQEVLRVDRVGLHDNFFDLGGNSLNVIQVSGRLREVMGQDIAVVTLFTYPTVGLLARQFKGNDGSGGEGESGTARFEQREEGKDRLKQQLARRRVRAQ